jgi:hypothetical protein
VINEKNRLITGEYNGITEILGILSISGDNQAVDPICELVRSCSDRWRYTLSPEPVMVHAIEALAKIGDPRAASTVVSAIAGNIPFLSSTNKVCQNISLIGDENTLIPFRALIHPGNTTAGKKLKSRIRKNLDWVQKTIANIEMGNGKKISEKNLGKKKIIQEIYPVC